MSEEKLYAVKNDEGKYWDFSGKVTGFWARSEVEVPATDDKDLASALAMGCGDCVVTFVEEPKKVVLTKEQAEIVEGARDKTYPATYISNNSDVGASGEEKLLMKAFANGYTVEKEKKYNVKVPKEWSGDDKHYWTKEQDGALTWAWLINKDYMIPTQQFTLTEIEHYGLQDCEKEEVTDDEV